MGITTKWEHLQWPPSSQHQQFASLLHCPWGQWTLPPSRLCSYCLVSPLPSRKRTPYSSLCFSIFLSHLQSSSVRHWCPQNCPHQGHQKLLILHSIACPSSSSTQHSSPILPFGNVSWISTSFHSIPFHSFHPIPSAPATPFLCIPGSHIPSGFPSRHFSRLSVSVSSTHVSTSKCCCVLGLSSGSPFGSLVLRCMIHYSLSA